VPNVVEAGTPFNRGKMTTLKTGTDVTIVAAGSMVSRALAAAEILALQGISANVINATFIAPLDTEALEAAADSTKAIITVEEANIAGGLGAAVASFISGLTDDKRVPVKILGTDDWSPTLSTDALYEHFGLTAENIAQTASEVLSRV
jgi:transketolase